MQENTPNIKTALPEKFYETLREEIALSEGMLVILAREKDALVSMDMPTIVATSGKKEACVVRLQALDAHLQEMARAFTGSPDSGTIRLRSLAAMLSPEELAYLEGFRVRLDRLREEIATRNLINRNFTEETSKFLSDAISLITNAVAERPAYGRGRMAMKPSTAGQPSFISREV